VALSPSLLYGLTGLMLFVIGLAALFTSPQLLGKILAVNIMASGIFLFLITLAHGSGTLIDPVPQAMVLTGIVVSVSSTAVALALLCRIEAAARPPAHLPKKKDEARQG